MMKMDDQIVADFVTLDLQVEPLPKLSTVNKHFRKLALLTHPDKGGNKDDFQELLAAYKRVGSFVSENCDIINDSDEKEAFEVFTKCNIHKINLLSVTVLIENELVHQWDEVLNNKYGPFVKILEKKQWKAPFDIDSENSVESTVTIGKWDNPSDGQSKLLIQGRGYRQFALNQLPLLYKEVKELSSATVENSDATTQPSILRLYTCDICLKAFTRKYQLITHKMTSHENSKIPPINSNPSSSLSASSLSTSLSTSNTLPDTKESASAEDALNITLVEEHLVNTVDDNEPDYSDNFIELEESSLSTSSSTANTLPDTEEPVPTEDTSNITLVEQPLVNIDDVPEYSDYSVELEESVNSESILEKSSTAGIENVKTVETATKSAEENATKLSKTVHLVLKNQETSNDILSQLLEKLDLLNKNVAALQDEVTTIKTKLEEHDNSPSSDTKNSSSDHNVNSSASEDKEPDTLNNVNNVPETDVPIDESAKAHSDNPEDFSEHIQTNEPNNIPSSTNTKSKGLWAGSSLSNKLDKDKLKSVTDCDITFVKAYTAVEDSSARYPKDNFTDVVPAELVKGKFDWLCLQGGSVEITNLDTRQDPATHLEYWKQQVHTSTSNLFKVAQNAIKQVPDLKKVIILNRIPRYDPVSVDPNQMKSKLSVYGNSVYQQLWMEAGCPDNIVVGEHSLGCKGTLRNMRYGKADSKEFDGIHLRGPAGASHYTNGVARIFKTVFPNLQSAQTKPPTVPANSPQSPPAPAQPAHSLPKHRPPHSQSHHLPRQRHRPHQHQPLPHQHHHSGFHNNSRPPFISPWLNGSPPMFTRSTSPSSFPHPSSWPTTTTPQPQYNIWTTPHNTRSWNPPQHTPYTIPTHNKWSVLEN